MMYKTINTDNILEMEYMGNVGQPEPTDETPIYISPYEIKPPNTLRKPRPKKTEEEVKQQKREIAKRHYYDNYEYKRFTKQYMLKII